MKKIANLEEYKFTVMAPGRDGAMVSRPIVTSDGDLLKTPLNTLSSVDSTGRTSITTREILKQIEKICNTIEKAQASKEKILLLEDADYKFLKERHDKYSNWSPQDDIRKCIIKMGEKLDNPEYYDPAKK